MQQRIFCQRKPRTRTQRSEEHETQTIALSTPAGGGTDGADELLAAIDALLDQPAA